MTLWNGDTPIMCEYTGCRKGAIEIKFIRAGLFGSANHTYFQLELPVCGDHMKDVVNGVFVLEEVKHR